MPAFDAAEFRAVLGHFPTCVTIVTTIDPKRSEPVGLTIGSFTSVSLEPPMVGFLPVSTSETLRAITESGRFAVNELSSGQDEWCWRFAKSGNEDQRFIDIDWSPSPGGSPLLPGVLAWIDCEVAGIFEMGDHHFVLGRVMALENHPDSELHRPMLFYRGALGHFANDD
jgi:3-hydroxy-9,10-secoandrosta-1,3,5(10)-triene-9,17-dione monooxygenase reductase component